jgi:hypothetical protein
VEQEYLQWRLAKLPAPLDKPFGLDFVGVVLILIFTALIGMGVEVLLMFIYLACDHEWMR